MIIELKLHLMKPLLLLIAVSAMTTSFAQGINADDFNLTKPSPENPVQYNLTHKNYTVTGNVVNACDSGSTTLSVTGACSYEWFSDSLGNNLIVSNADLITQTLYNDTTFYLSAGDAVNSTAVAIGSQTSTFSGSVRGYYFQSPSNFTITALWVPTDASTGTSNIAVVRFNSGPPPAFSSTTNDFTLLGYWPQATDDSIYVCIPVQAGDYIGVLGNRGDVNSYLSTPTSTIIDGNSVNLMRCGMQFPLSSTAPQDLWTESGNPISRVFFSYSTSTASSISPISVTVPQSYNSISNIQICEGDSVDIYGSYQDSEGVYIDSSLTIYGCDSVTTTNLSFSVVDVTGSVNGLTLTANLSGVSYQWIDCGNGNTVIQGETNQSFTASANGSYAVIINDGTCSDTSECWVISNVELGELYSGRIEIFPNPTIDKVTILSSEPFINAHLYLLDLNGRVITSNEGINGNEIELDMSQLSVGSYLLKIKENETIFLIKVLKN